MTQYPSPDLLYRALGNSLAVAQAFPASAYDSQPASGMMTVGEIIDHVASDLEYVIAPIASRFSIAINEISAADPVEHLKQANDRVRHVLDQVPLDQWLTDIEYPDGYTMSVVRAALVMLEHDAHHRGQLIVVLRTLGIEPPKRWADS